MNDLAQATLEMQPRFEAADSPASAVATEPLDIEAVRRDFPILATEVHSRPLVYLDNAATAQKPRAVIDAVSRYYSQENANIHRGVHYLSQYATDAYDHARDTVARFLNAASSSEVVFLRGATEAINLVAHGFERAVLQPGDEILLTELEHHANIVPWQEACERSGAVLKVVPVDDDGKVDLEAFEALLGERTRLLTCTHVSNALGTIQPLQQMIMAARERGIATLVDGCQAAPHLAVDVRELGCDFYCFSGHKLFGPTGIGVLWARAEWLERLPPYQTGGDMIRRVTFEKTTFAPPPQKFEAGTPHIAGTAGLAAAIEYLEKLGLERVRAWEEELGRYAAEALRSIDGLKLYAGGQLRVPVFSFTLAEVHPHDIGTFLDADGIAIRAGHHCAQPLMSRLGIPGTARASLAFYNTRDEVDALIAAIRKVMRFFG